MNIENIEAFVYIVHFNSFNKAAEALYVSQPSISARIQSLERELSVRLFEREGRHFTLTEKGKQFLPYAQNILKTYKAGRQQLQVAEKQSDELRIGCTLSGANYILPEVLPVFKRKHRHIRIKLLTAPSETILEKVLAKELDVGLTRSMSHPDVESEQLYEDPIRLFVHRSHPFARKISLSMEEVGREPIVFFECGSLDWNRIHRLFQTLDVPPRIEMQIDNLETAKKLVVGGMGISFLPELSVRKEIREGVLLPLEMPQLSGISLRTHLLSLKGQGTELGQLFGEVIRGMDLTAGRPQASPG
ncbi:LysR family transcriptional regulator [Paenibacillus mucilaginosus]|uniref:LysR family transcriptional regulator n=3 Tax=Paenibacillus mucilaginosus TaxID=61624 RepID=H6NPW5_9BACL|nr:LysR family transcriptional regulator [Paenibacillus mucilaginosus]AEI43515.1 transcriptional regulator, LysR family [Paenibacillus mucilaginosus KNP414]AFC31156.1 LysR family transcriptional regulator [Paenibacillus mucilaginosus 3016]AFH63478.1 LysR family transcriptional regulator [Paenibacillus mucilaginosus K02]MCG7211943.1 LysR family transcriptional regulator [Paenibacillus mucilaginosus]WDM25063.1 LysR family transcriptional regulator [Paenibacillus mucilaginosus]